MVDVIGTIERLSIVPVIVIDDPAHAGPLAAALEEGGLPCAEITFRTARAAEALRRITGGHPGMLAGAGTVLNESQAREARDAGAAFVVSPGFSRPVVEYCLGHDLPVFPGVCTPTEVGVALEMGVSVLKFFPAEAMGGVPTLQAISSPYRGVRFMPTGGISPENVRRYLALPNVIACGGSWMAPADWIAEEQFDRITATVRNAVMIAAEGDEARK
ncbi:MAG: bifunctional 4-hydroxy-2-oxoglutarate aldolase/2-dehydro-3-deoxy-phosphogluconate aldolase [Gemmatimonadaceae bacterium]